RRVICKKAVQLGLIRGAKHAHVRPSTGPRPGDDFSPSLAVDIAGGDIHSAGETGGVGEELTDHGVLVTAEYANVRAAARSSRGNDLHSTIEVDVGRGKPHSAGKCGRIGEELAD